MRNALWHFTRKSIPERLREAGIEFTFEYRADQGGHMVVALPSGEELTPGQARDRFLTED